MNYKKIIISVIIAVFSISLSFNAVSSEPKQINDPRIGLKLTSSEKAEFLQEMRQMLKESLIKSHKFWQRQISRIKACEFRMLVAL